MLIESSDVPPFITVVSFYELVDFAFKGLIELPILLLHQMAFLDVIFKLRYVTYLLLAETVKS